MEQKEADWRKILAYFRSGRSLTKLQCLYKFGCINLQGRVWDLEQIGHTIDREWIELPNGKRIKRYFIKEFQGRQTI